MKKPGPKFPTAPRHLSQESKTWWKRFNSGWAFDDAALLILEALLQARDRWAQAMETISREGTTTTDRFGQAKVHPAVLIERDSRAAMSAGVKQLNLDLEPLLAPGRPAGGKRGL